MLLPPDNRDLPPFQRILAASTFSLTALAAVLLWLVYKDRDAGINWPNALRALGAGIAIALAVKGTRLRYRPQR